jgi:hypothetical protein
LGFVRHPVGLAFRGTQPGPVSTYAGPTSAAAS